MPDEEEPGGIQTVPELFNQALLLGFVKIDHDVAAENNVVAARQELGLEVVKIKLDECFEGWPDRILGSRLFEIAKAASVIDGVHLVLRGEALLAEAEACIACGGRVD